MPPSISIRSPVAVASPLSRLSSRETISVCGSGRYKVVPVDPIKEKVIGQYNLNTPPPRAKRISTEDVMVNIGEKIKPCNFPAIRKSFRANDPRGKGRIPREAFSRVIWQHCGYVPQKQINHILKRLHLDKQKGITFEEFVERLAELGITKSTALPETTITWTKSVAQGSRPFTTSWSNRYDGETVGSGNGNNVWRALKHKVSKENFDPESVFPPACFGAGAYVVPPQLREVLRKLNIEFIDDDIAKIFRRIDGASPYAVHTKKLFDLLGIKSAQVDSSSMSSRKSSAGSRRHSKSDLPKDKEERPLSPTIKSESKRPWTTQGRPRSRQDNGVEFNVNRPKSSMVPSCVFEGDIAKLFADKLDEPSVPFVRILKARDKSDRGLLTKTEFRTILSEFGISARATDLEHFLMRNGLRRKDGIINYKLILRRLMSRSNRSLLHKVINNPTHAFHGPCSSPVQSDGASASIMEAKLLDIFQKNFLLILNSLKQYDRNQSGTISLEDFRGALEDHLNCVFSDESWLKFTSSSYVHLVPPTSASDNQTFVNYNDFLSKFDVILRPSSADEEDPWHKMNDDADLLREHKEKYLKGMSGDMNEYTLRHDPEPLPKLEEKMVRVFLTQFKQFKQEYDNIVREDDCRVDKEKFDFIMFRCGFILTASELSRLWLSLPITRPIESVSFPALLKHVIKLHYANSLPKKFTRSSSEGTIMSYIMDKMRSQVISNWKRLKERLRFWDPMGTSRIPMDDMISLLYECRPPVIDLELFYLVWMLESRIPLKTNYFKFMEYYTRSPSQHGSRSSRNEVEYSLEPALSDTTSVIALRPKPQAAVIPQHGFVYQRKPQSPFISLRNAPDKPVFKRVTKHKDTDRGARSYPRRYDASTVPEKFTNIKQHPYLSADQAKKLYRLSAVDLVRHPVSSMGSEPPSSAPGCSRLDIREIPALRKAFRKQDFADNGHLPLDTFKQVMKRYGVQFKSEDDMYRLLSKYDTKMKQVVSYERFLKNIRL